MTLAQLLYQPPKPFDPGHQVQAQRQIVDELKAIREENVRVAKLYEEARQKRSHLTAHPWGT